MDNKTLAQIAKSHSTPLYIFDADEFKLRTQKVKKAFGDKCGLCYSIKANPFLLSALPQEFSHIEVCSPGELTICEKTGADMSKVIFSGVNKTPEDISRALQDKVGIFTAESLLHIEYIDNLAAERGLKVPVILRISNGSQFGMDEREVVELIKNRDSLKGCDIIGLHYFTGTQKKKVKPIVKELSYLDELAQKLKADFDFEMRHLEYGTGLAADYFGEDPESADMALLDELSGYIREFSEKYPLTVEMGRFFAASCGVYMTKVMDTKTVHDINYAICDGGVHHMKYYGQNMAMQIPPITVLDSDNREKSFWSLCGSLCTTADVLVRNVELPSLKLEDVLAFHKTGAYSVMEGITLLLSRSLPKVVMYSHEKGAILLRDTFFTDILNTPNGI